MTVGDCTVVSTVNNVRAGRDGFRISLGKIICFKSIGS